jgi:hypothetical protein
MAMVAVFPMWRNACPRPTFSQGGRGDGGDDHVAGPGAVGQLRDGVELVLGHVLAVGLEDAFRKSHLRRDVAERLEVSASGDLEI